jgi:signal transduction histidine kinase
MHRRSSTVVLQIVFLVILLVSVGQVTWWIIDNLRYSSHIRDSVAELYIAEAEAADRLVEEGVSPSLLREMFPRVVFEGESIVVDPAAIDSLVAARHQRVNRVGWEGAFFLLVLVSAMGVIAKAIRQDSTFRSRQRNFIAAVTHELKSPIASLQLATETLSLRHPTPEDFKRLTGRMMADISRLNGLVTNVLDASRLERGLSRNTGSVTLADEVIAAAAEIQDRVDAAGVTLEIENETGAILFADALGVRTVLRNVLDNALKATVSVEDGSVKLSARDVGGRTEIVISDNGIGFDPTDSKRLFERFFRPGNEMRREMQGTGLGLYIVKRLMESDGGTSVARSEGQGKGAAFILSWPRVEEAG